MRSPYELWSIVYRYYSNRSTHLYLLCIHSERLYLRNILSLEEHYWIVAEILKDCEEGTLGPHLYRAYPEQVDCLWNEILAVQKHILRCLYLQDKIMEAIGK